MADVQMPSNYSSETLRRNSSYHNCHQSPHNLISHSISVNTIPSLPHDYLIEQLINGQRFNGRMSNVRRFFCLFVLFDVLFTCLMWLICIMLNGENITDAFQQQIFHYNIHTALIDVVFVAFSRFLVLQIFYGLCYINHWIIIFLSTALTSIFLIGKVVVYNWPHSSQPAFEVFLILTSFVLCWGEGWFLDCRVLPQEQYAGRYVISNINPERAPLIQNYVNSLPSIYSEGDTNFYSPRGTPEGSVYGDNINREINYNVLSAQIIQEAWDLLRKSEWKLEKQQNIDSIYTLNLHNTKIYKLTTFIEHPANVLLKELFDNVESLQQWNQKSILESKRIVQINDNSDITYQVSANGAGGLVSSRDFVTFRHWKCIENVYIIAYIATIHELLPKNDKYVRGENGIGCYAIQINPNDSNKCYFQWILNTNLNFNGWLPQYALDKALMTTMFEFIKNLRKHLNELK